MIKGRTGKVGKKAGKTVAEAGLSVEAAVEGMEARDEIASLNDRLLRLQADFDNFRKRTVREKSEVHRLANEELLSELLPALDSMDRAINGAVDHEADTAILDGFKLVAGQLQSILGKFGLGPMDAHAAEFDPNLHEAVSHLPSDTVPDGVVMVQTRRGYMLGEKLLRAAQVVVSSGPGTDGGQQIEEELSSAEWSGELLDDGNGHTGNGE